MNQDPGPFRWRPNHYYYRDDQHAQHVPHIARFDKRTPKLDLPKLDGNVDPYRFLQTFENACEVYGEYTDDAKVQLFSMTMVDKSREWFFNLDRDDRQDWSELKESFVKRFQPFRLAESLFVKLSNIKMKKDEQVRDYIERFKRLRSQVQEESIEKMLIIWFLVGLPRRSC